MRHLIGAYGPTEIAQRVLDVGVTKARIPLPDTLGLAVLAGELFTGNDLVEMAWARRAISYG